MFSNSLVILGRRQRHGMASVDEGKETCLFSLQILFDDGLSFASLVEDCPDCRASLLARERDGYTLAPCEPVRLDDDRQALFLNGAQGLRFRSHPAVTRRWDVLETANVLGEALGSLKPSRRLGWAEGGNARILE